MEDVKNTTEKPPLVERMRAYADKLEAEPGCAGEGALLRQRAAELETATNGFWGSPQTVTGPQFLGCFARARRLWSDTTGEPLV